MVEEEKIQQKKVEVKEKPLGETKMVEETEAQRVSEQPSTTAQPGRAENMATKSGETIGAGLKKVASVIGEFTAGVSKEMKSGEPQKGEEQAQRTEVRSEETERTQEAPQGKVVEKEKTEKKVTEEKE